ncbi:MAG TPA: hypothetical protein VKA19_13860 [Alphaproteobacteria bacterium]|nr:hypothetical protein [Alphaproteobacteria bacterium]
MNWPAVSAIAELLGALAVVVSLIYVAVQVKASTRQARLEAARDLAARFSETSLAVASSREMGELFHRGGGDYQGLDAIDQLRYRSLMNSLFRGLELQFHLRREGALDDEEWAAVESMILDFASLPGVKTYFAERGHWYTPAFLDIAWRGAPSKDRPAGPPMADQYRPKSADDEATSA